MPDYQRPHLHAAALGALALCLALGARAQASAPNGSPAADEARAAERIRVERAAAQADYERKVQACAGKFAVTSCVDAARAERHATLARLDREQLAIDEARRQRRAAERRGAIEDKLSGEEAARREAAARARSDSAAAAGSVAPKAAQVPASGARVRQPKPEPDASQRAAEEVRARNAYQLKLLQAEAHRREVEERNADRARKASPGASLPLPTPASAPR